jgi:hypothetical protein
MWSDGMMAPRIRQLTEAAIDKARAETAARICAWLRDECSKAEKGSTGGTFIGCDETVLVTMIVNAIERGDWKAK